MNNGRIWCVVNPTVGLPAFLGSVALISFTVHFAVLNNTTWIKDYWSGGAQKTAANESKSAPVALTSHSGAPAFVINVTPAAGTSGKEAAAFVVTVTPAADRPPGDFAVAMTPQE